MKCEYITPAVTIFDENRKLDIESLHNLYDHLIKGGVDGILILGSIGEFFAIPIESKKELIRLAVKKNQQENKTAGWNCKHGYKRDYRTFKICM